MLKKLLLVLFFSSLFFSCQGQSPEEIQEQMFQSVKNADLEALMAAVKAGANLNSRGNINGSDGHYSALEYSAGEGNLEMVKYILERGIDINANNMALNYAAIAGNFEIVKSLVEKGFNINNGDNTNNARTPLHAAIFADKIDVAKYLIDNGADFNKINNEGESAISMAASNGQLEIVEYLVQKGANIHGDENNSPIHSAARHLDVFTYLVQKGADFNKIDKYGNTILHSVAGKGNKDLIKYYVDFGIDVKAINKNLETALDIAKKSEIQREEVIEYLESVSN